MVKIFFKNNLDSNGYIAFNEPGLMNKKVWFYVNSPGYKIISNDIFGFQGLTIETKQSEESVILMNRLNIAKRLYRHSGYGIYRDSILLKKKIPIKEGLLENNVFGLDSTFVNIFKGKLRW